MTEPRSWVDWEERPCLSADDVPDVSAARDWFVQTIGAPGATDWERDDPWIVELLVCDHDFGDAHSVPCDGTRRERVWVVEAPVEF